MTDKMMRIAGRNSAGLAKPLEINDKGRLTTSDSEAQRIQKKYANLLDEYYYKGVKALPFSQGFKSGNGTIVESDEYVELTLSGNATNTAEITYESDGPIDVTDLDIFYAEIEAFPNATYNASARMTLGTARGFSSDGGTTRRVIFDILKGTTSNKMLLKMNVSDLTGNLYLRIHIRDGSLSADIHFKIRIFSIYGERISIPSRNTDDTVDSSLMAKDYNNSANDVSLTAVLDNENKAALRVIDAAPWGYDADSDSLRSVRSPVEFISALSSSQSLAANATFETVVFDTSAFTDMYILLNTGAVNSPVEVTVNYFMSDAGGTKIKRVKVVEEVGSPEYSGASATFKPTTPFVSLTVTNKATDSRTVNLQVLGGR